MLKYLTHFTMIIAFVFIASANESSLSRGVRSALWPPELGESPEDLLSSAGFCFRGFRGADSKVNAPC